MSGARAGVVRGMRHAIRGIGLIFKPGVRAFVIVPLLISTVLLVTALVGAGMLLDWLVETYLSSWWAWAQWIATVVYWLISAIIVFFTFTLFANLVASPFNGMLAEAVERHLNPGVQEVPFSFERLLDDAARSIRAELRKLGYIGIRALPLVLISFTPGLQFAAPPLWFIFGAWMLSLEYLDCPLGNHGRMFPAAVYDLRSTPRMALGFGGCITVLTMIPLVNFLAMPVGVAGATSMYFEHFAGSDADP